ncbi:response regulator transcription factor [Alphaproteobacteria bacterium]|mgnify:FL=1|jgi:DNA-binding NarL/FixJ family response regulator|nr:response regulator transcription factor [Alphaproteobacteria bacterium]
MINIAVLEDDLYLQQRFVRIFKDWDYVQQVFTCSDNAEFLACLDSHHIDILLADLDLPDGRGNQSIKAFSTTAATAITIVISSSMDSAVILQAIADGAVGYIHKGDESSEIITVIKTALAGDSPISPSIANKIVATLQNNENDIPHSAISLNRTGRQPEDHGDANQKAEILSPRELEVLNLISRGLSYSEVASTLSISQTTVPVHIRNIYRKLQSKNRSEAVFEARNLGLLN